MQGGVLLQNNGALPIDSDLQDVVVIGKASQVYAQQAVAGGAQVGPADGLRRARQLRTSCRTTRSRRSRASGTSLTNLGNTTAHGAG